MGPPDAAERRPQPEATPQIATEPTQDHLGIANDTPYETDLFGEPIVAAEPSLPRKNSAEHSKHLNALPLPHGWKFWALAPELPNMPTHIESIYIIDQERNRRRIFIDRRTGQECHFDPDNGWSS
jgi:hypothetical protein